MVSGPLSLPGDSEVEDAIILVDPPVSPLVVNVLPCSVAPDRTVDDGVVPKHNSKLFIEVGCGSARLAGELSKLGVTSFGIDLPTNMMAPKGRRLLHDFCNTSVFTHIVSLVHATQIHTIYISPPLSTFHKSLSKHSINIVGDRRERLRSETEPRGFGTITDPVQKNRVAKENLFMDKVCELIGICIEHNVFCYLECPHSSCA